jgi:hypothetical protein
MPHATNSAPMRMETKNTAPGLWEAVVMGQAGLR